MPELTEDEARRAAYYEEKTSEKMMRRARENPMVPLGLIGLTGMVAYGAYGFKNRGSMKPSVYLMHLRVKAQSMVIGAITIGVAAALCQRMYTTYAQKK